MKPVAKRMGELMGKETKCAPDFESTDSESILISSISYATVCIMLDSTFVKALVLRSYSCRILQFIMYMNAEFLIDLARLMPDIQCSRVCSQLEQFHGRRELACIM